MATKYVRSSHTVSMASLFHGICEKKRSNSIQRTDKNDSNVPEVN